jgi:ketosteroid isomerase-like protein
LRSQEIVMSFQQIVSIGLGRHFSRAVPAMLALGMLSGAPAQAAAPTEDAAKLTALDHAMQKSVVDRDAEAFASFLTDDYILITSSSKRLGKADVVEGIDSPNEVMTVNASTIVDIRVHGDTALVIADLHQVGKQKDEAFDYWVRYTDTWVRDKDSWLCISGHASRLTAPH